MDHSDTPQTQLIEYYSQASWPLPVQVQHALLCRILAIKVLLAILPLGEEELALSGMLVGTITCAMNELRILLVGL